MKRILIAAVNVLTVLLCGSAYLLEYFADRKLGMVRWLNYHNANITDAVPVNVVKYVVLACVALLAVAIVRRLWSRRGQVGAAPWLGAVFMTVVVVAYFAAVLLATSEATKAWVFILAACGLAAVLQVLTMGIVALRAGKKGRRARP